MLLVFLYLKYSHAGGVSRPTFSVPYVGMLVTRFGNKTPKLHNFILHCLAFKSIYNLATAVFVCADNVAYTNTMTHETTVMSLTRHAANNRHSTASIKNTVKHVYIDNQLLISTIRTVDIHNSILDICNLKCEYRRFTSIEGINNSSC